MKLGKKMIKKVILILFFFSLGLVLNVNAAVVKRPKIVGSPLPELMEGKARLFIGGQLGHQISSVSGTGKVSYSSPPKIIFHILEQRQEKLVPVARIMSAINNRLPRNRFYIDIDAGERVLAFYHIESGGVINLYQNRPIDINKAKHIFEEGKNYYFTLNLVKRPSNKRLRITNLEKYEVDNEKMQFCQSLRLLKKSERPKRKQLKKMYEELGIESWAERYACQLSFQAKPYTMSEKRKKSMNKFISSQYERLMRSIDYGIYRSYIEKKKVQPQSESN